MLKSLQRYVLLLWIALFLITFNVNHSSAQRKPLYEKDSLYYHIIVLENPPCRYLKFDFDMSHYQSGMNLSDPNKSCLPYANYIPLCFTFNPTANDFLITGLGGGSLPKLLYEINPDFNIDVVELDPEVLRVTEKFFYFKNGVHANVFINDARIFIKKAKKKYDIVILDAYKAELVPYHLLTKEYFEELASILNEDGLLFLNMYDPHDQKLHKPVIKTLRTIFNDVSLFDILDDADIIVARNNKHKTTLKSLKNGAKIFKDKYGLDLEERIQTLREEIHIDQNVPLFTDDYSPGSLYRFAN